MRNEINGKFGREVSLVMDIDSVKAELDADKRESKITKMLYEPVTK